MNNNLDLINKVGDIIHREFERCPSIDKVFIIDDFVYLDGFLPVGKTATDGFTRDFFYRKLKELSVHHPSHYGGKDNPYEAIKVIEAWGLGFCLGNTIKYISRAGKKNNNPSLQDLEKAAWYLNREIQALKNK
jgi:hypothetical protein